MKKLAIERVGVLTTNFNVPPFFQLKPFFSIRSAILPIPMACSILSTITTRLVKCCAELPTRYSKYGALKVLENKLIISFSNMRGLTCAATSLHLRAYSLMDSLLSFSIACKLNRSRPTSILNLYCLIKASTKSFHFLTLVLSNRIYQVRAASLKLS